MKNIITLVALLGLFGAKFAWSQTVAPLTVCEQDNVKVELYPGSNPNKRLIIVKHNNAVQMKEESGYRVLGNGSVRYMQLDLTNSNSVQFTFEGQKFTTAILSVNNELNRQNLICR